MLRPILTLSALVMASAPVAASTYSAQLDTPRTARIITSDILWSCGSGACQGSTEESRPAVLCQSLARQAGKVGSFHADGRAFTTAELAKCNSAAKADGGSSVAAK